LTTDVEEDEEEVECDQAEEPVDLGESSLPLEVVQSIIFRELLIERFDMFLCLVHVEKVIARAQSCSRCRGRLS